MQFGEKVRQERERQELDRIDLRERSGLSASYLHEVEAGVLPASQERREKIADALGVPLLDLEDD